MGEILFAHSSDIHVDERHGTTGLLAVLATARAAGVQLVLLAGDTFESNQLPQPLVETAGAMLAAAGMPVILLPGNTTRRCRAPYTCAAASERSPT
jgi:DNA repair exonuclease SbcCD nuclease subunit